MKILVTGGAGFIGSHVVDAYVKKGHDVTVLDNLVTGRRAQVSPRARFVRGDVRNRGLRRLFRKERFDVVNHHAAQMDVRHSVRDPRYDADVNILGLINLLELSRETGVKKVIFAASGGTYYGECWRPAVESDPARPLSPYGVSKLTSEFYLRAYQDLHGQRFTVLRYGNVYGPRQNPHGEAGVVAIFCSRLLAGEAVTIYGDGDQKRDYVFVGDVADANVQALERGDNTAINIGTSRAVSVNELFRELSRNAPGALAPAHQPVRPGELRVSVLNRRRAARVLRWTPRVSLRDGLRQTFLWVKGHRSLRR